MDLPAEIVHAVGITVFHREAFAAHARNQFCCGSFLMLRGKVSNHSYAQRGLRMFVNAIECLN